MRSPARRVGTRVDAWSFYIFENRERAAREVERLIEKYTPSRLAEETRRELTQRMQREARRFGMRKPPGLT